MKEVKSGKIEPQTHVVRVGQTATVETDDGMCYVFKKPEWSDTWYFSHRIEYVTSDDEGWSSKNWNLPQKVEEWADENLGDWEWAEGNISYVTKDGFSSKLVKEKNGR